MKKLHILILLCLCLVGHAQNQDLINAYNQVTNTLDRYEFEPETENWNSGYDSKSIKLTYNYPNLIISFYLELPKGRIRDNDISGTYKLICPLSTAFVVEEDKYGNGKYAKLFFRNSNGIEQVYNGKSTLIEEYYFLSTRLTIIKLCDELNILKEHILTSQYKGALGISSSTSSQKGESSNSSEQTPQSIFSPTEYKYKYYNESGFAIKEVYKLEKDTLFIDAFRRQNHTEELELISAYTYFQNAETQNPYRINVINIVVYRIDAPAEQTLAEYKRSLIANRFLFNNKTWNGLQGLEYYFKQDMGDVMLNTIAFYGYKGNRFYLIQIGAVVLPEAKYEALLNAIKIL